MHDSAGPGLKVIPVKATLIIPALNEANAIGCLLRRVPRELVDEVIVVDYGSTDATSSIAASAGARVINEPRRGYGAACWAGVTALRPDTDIAVFLDGAGSQHPEELPQVLAPLVADRADLVLGARQFGGDHPLHAALGTRLVAAFVAWRYRVTLSDIGLYRAIRVPLLKRWVDGLRLGCIEITECGLEACDQAGPRFGTCGVGDRVLEHLSPTGQGLDALLTETKRLRRPAFTVTQGLSDALEVKLPQGEKDQFRDRTVDMGPGGILTG